MTRDDFNQMLEDNGIVFVGEAAWHVAQLVAAAEREQCAQLVEKFYSSNPNLLASAIRARGET